MKNRIFLFLMVALMALFVTSCKEDEIVESSIQVTTQGFAHLQKLYFALFEQTLA